MNRVFLNGFGCEAVRQRLDLFQGELAYRFGEYVNVRREMACLKKRINGIMNRGLRNIATSCFESIRPIDFIQPLILNLAILSHGVNQGPIIQTIPAPD